MDLPQEIRFDGWTLLRHSGELVKDGRRVRLQTQPLHVLEELLARPGELVSREHLIARLWPRGVVDFDTALNSAVRRLRTALGDHAGSPRHIETVPRRGYRFIGRVEPDFPTPPAPTERLQHRVPARALPPRQVLVATAAMLALGTVASFESGEPRRTPEIGVAARPAATALPRPGASAVAIDARAEERYLRGRHFFNRRGAGDLALARQYFEAAITIEPGHARAWAGLAGCNWVETMEGSLPRPEGLERTRQAAERALELNPRLAEAHLRLAVYYRAVGDRPRGNEHERLAAELEPDNVMVLGFAAGDAWSEGRVDEALALMRRAVEVEPLSNLYRGHLAAHLYFAGRLDEVRSVLAEMLEVDPSARVDSEFVGLLAIHDGRFAEALELARGWRQDVDRLQVQALALHGLGRHAESDAALRVLVETHGNRDPLRIAEVHSYRGEFDEAFEWLRVAEDRLKANGWKADGFRNPGLAAHLPLLQPLRSDRRWDAWLESSHRQSAELVLAIKTD